VPTEHMVSLRRP